MARKIKDPGLGYSSNKNEQSFINSDGSTNIVHINREKNIQDLYAYLIGISWFHFFSLVTIGYILVNILFALGYLYIGIEKLNPSTGIGWKDFLNAFFFSAQTITTVGYGAISPSGIGAGILSTFEALIGLLSFSFITGLLYGRFSKPKASVKFSKNIVYRTFEKDTALMFRLMSRRINIMIEPEIKVTLSISEKNKKGKFERAFYELKLQRNAITYLPTMWTIVHVIDENSPLSKYSKKELSELNAKLYILFQYHEDSFSQKVYQIHSYDFSNLKIDYKFSPSVQFNEEGKTVLDHAILDKVEKM